MEEKNWLIRSIDNKIYGPVSKSKLIDLINNGKINNFDELCKANNYWFYLSEKNEVKKFLGLDLEPETDEGPGNVTEDLEPKIERFKESQKSDELEEEAPQVTNKFKLPAEVEKKNLVKDVMEEDTPRPMPLKKESSLKYILPIIILLLVIVLSVFYYYKNILGKPIPFISSAEAQAERSIYTFNRVGFDKEFNFPEQFKKKN